MANKEVNIKRFVSLLRETQREGIDLVIDRLEDKGFFEAPASTKFHLNIAGGLLQHSLNVYDVAVRQREMMLGLKPELENRLPMDSVKIASLLHDVCKSSVYKPAKERQLLSRFVKEVGTYRIDYTDYPAGHGEKSALQLLMWGLRLTEDEVLAIRWHMSVWHLPMNANDIIANYGVAQDKCPLLMLIQISDSIATNIVEV